MKIAFISAASSIHTAKWVNALSNRGHEVHLICNKGHEAKADLLDERVVCHVLKCKGMAGYYINALELHSIIKVMKPDVINVHYASGYGTLARMARIDPYLLSVWGSDVYEFPNESKIKAFILKKNIRNAERIASTSVCMAEELRRVMKMPELKIEITPFGVDMDIFDKNKYPEKQKEFITIGIIKALEEVYRIGDFIRAISKLMLLLTEEDAKRIKVEIYGEGAQKKELENEVNELGLKEVIEFKGRIPNTSVPAALSGLDIFCVTSEKESFGVAVVEAMAMGLPVVTTDAEGFKEVVVDRENGIIVKKRDVDAIASALKELVTDEKLREMYGRNGFKRARELYDWKKNVDHMEEIYGLEV